MKVLPASQPHQPGRAPGSRQRLSRLWFTLLAILLVGLSAGLLTGCNLNPAPQIETLPLTGVSPEPTSAILNNSTPNAPSEPPYFTFNSAVVNHLQGIYLVGQARGNRPDVFARVGDSITVSASFLQPIGDGFYHLAAYPQLQAVIDAFTVTPARDGGANSFATRSAAAGVGWSAFAVLSTAYTEGSLCNTGETPLVCEYRAIRPAIALIMFGTNDVGYREAAEYRADLNRIVDVSEQMGVIPVLSTIPPRPGLEGRIAEFNTIVTAITTERSLPLWDYGGAMAGLPGYGLTTDQVHPSSSPLGYNHQADFSATNLRYGYVVRNLTALQMLDSVWKQMQPG